MKRSEPTAQDIAVELRRTALPRGQKRKETDAVESVNKKEVDAWAPNTSHRRNGSDDVVRRRIIGGHPNPIESIICDQVLDVHDSRARSARGITNSQRDLRNVHVLCCPPGWVACEKHGRHIRGIGRRGVSPLTEQGSH